MNGRNMAMNDHTSMPQTLKANLYLNSEVFVKFIECLPNVRSIEISIVVIL